MASMTEYVKAIKRALRDQHSFRPLAGSTDDDPKLDVPDGEYLLNIDGHDERVKIENGRLYCGKIW